MSFRQGAAREERRRRLLTEDAPAAGEATRTAAPATRTRAKLSRSRSSKMFTSPRVADLIPKSYLTWGLIALVGAAMIAGLVALYIFMPQIAARTTDGTIAAFNLDDEGSLATWLSSLLLTLSAMLALIVYNVRKQRADDYHGRYRIWLWAGACWLVMSIDETSSLHEGFKELMVVLTGQRIMGDGSIWWAMPYALVLGGVGTRLLVDLRRARVAAACFLLAGACFAAAVLTQMDFVVRGALHISIALEEGLEMAGDMSLFLAMGLAARHMILDAQGLLATPKRAAKKTTATAEKKVLSDGRKAAIHAAHTSLSGPKQGDYATGRKDTSSGRPGGQASSRYEDEDDEDEDQDDRNRLSRAERKALRRMRRDER